MYLQDFTNADSKLFKKIVNSILDEGKRISNLLKIEELKQEKQFDKLEFEN